MFDKSLEDLIVTIYLATNSMPAANENGLTLERSFSLTYAEAVELLNKMKRLLPGVPKYQIKMFRSVMKQICFAFGPEFDNRHGNF